MKYLPSPPEALKVFPSSSCPLLVLLVRRRSLVEYWKQKKIQLSRSSFTEDIVHCITSTQRLFKLMIQVFSSTEIAYDNTTSPLGLYLDYAPVAQWSLENILYSKTIRPSISYIILSPHNQIWTRAISLWQRLKRSDNITCKGLFLHQLTKTSCSKWLSKSTETLLDRWTSGPVLVHILSGLHIHQILRELLREEDLDFGFKTQHISKTDRDDPVYNSSDGYASSIVDASIFSTNYSLEEIVDTKTLLPMVLRMSDRSFLPAQTTLNESTLLRIGPSCVSSWQSQTIVQRLMALDFHIINFSQVEWKETDVEALQNTLGWKSSEVCVGIWWLVAIERANGISKLFSQLGEPCLSTQKLDPFRNRNLPSLPLRQEFGNQIHASQNSKAAQHELLYFFDTLYGQDSIIAKNLVL